MRDLQKLRTEIVTVALLYTIKKPKKHKYLTIE